MQLGRRDFWMTMWRPTQVDHTRLGLRDAEVTHHRALLAAIEADGCSLPTHSRLRWRGQLTLPLFNPLRRFNATEHAKTDLVHLVRNTRLEAIEAGREYRDAVHFAAYIHVRCAHPSRPHVAGSGIEHVMSWSVGPGFGVRSVRLRRAAGGRTTLRG